ncbi:MAG: hypothetical protein A3C53_01010 [Omnitrophica WOR_2 bacterium RIFCSPHIGHO2_02_FULL_68_15]|nr:MAG: hypothetical protein A3C53_01010 [Omnitrophica WOR_2 bacterium RIFCSPHIGHO2_02_FULL_68_15]
MIPPKRLVTKKLGELLVERKAITAAQLEQALSIQQEKGGLLGQILVGLGYTTEETIAQALTTQYGFPYLPLKNYTIDEETLKLIPANVARQYCLVPVDRLGDTLTIAMADPFNRKAVEDIELLHHCAAQIFVSTPTDIFDAIERHYRKGA